VNGGDRNRGGGGGGGDSGGGRQQRGAATINNKRQHFDFIFIVTVKINLTCKKMFTELIFDIIIMVHTIYTHVKSSLKYKPIGAAPGRDYVIV